jgi:hypothetical protein
VLAQLITPENIPLQQAMTSSAAAWAVGHGLGTGARAVLRLMMIGRRVAL